MTKVALWGIGGVITVAIVGCQLLSDQEQADFDRRIAMTDDEIKKLEQDIANLQYDQARGAGGLDPAEFETKMEAHQLELRTLREDKNKIVRDLRQLEERRLAEGVEKGATIAKKVGGLATFLPIPGVPAGGALLESLATFAMAWAERKKKNGQATG